MSISISRLTKVVLLQSIIFIPLLLSGCSGDGFGLDINGNPIGPGSSDTVSFSRDIQPIFDQSCIRCHFGAGAPEGLDLSAGKSYNNLVNIPSTEVPSLDRVEPFRPDTSYLVWKIEGDSGITGERMPFGGPYLADQTIALIRKWILQGALNN